MGQAIDKLLASVGNPKPAPLPTPQPQPGIASKANNFVQNLSTHMASFGEGILSPVTKLIASGVRAVQATPDVLSGNTQAANQKMAEPLNMGLQNGPQATLGGSSTTQNLGSAAQAASFLVPGTELGPISGGAVAGGLQTGGQAAEDPNATATSVAENTAGGAAAGAGLGAAAEYGPEALQKVLPKSEPNENVLSTRVADATPDYNKNMVGQNVTTPKGESVPRVNEGKGLTGNRTVTTSASEAENGAELGNLKDYPDNGTALQKSQAVNRAISTEAESMRGNLQAEDKASPLDANAEKAKVTDLVKSNLPKDIQDKIGYISQDNPLSKLGVKDNPQTPLNKALQEMSASPEDSLPKTAAGRYYGKVLDAVKDYDGTREGKLDLRQTIDTAYKNARGKLAFGSDSQNALDETNTDIRDSLNKDLKATTQNTDTQASLDKQSKLYRAKSVLDNKAQVESTSKIGRYGQRHPLQKSLGRRLGMREIATLGAGAAGLTYLGSQVNKAVKNAASGQ